MIKTPLMCRGCGVVNGKKGEIHDGESFANRWSHRGGKRAGVDNLAFLFLGICVRKWRKDPCRNFWAELVNDDNVNLY